MRLAPEVTTLGGEPPLGSMQRMVAAAVERRAGETLRAASTSVDPERGLVVLAFERVRAAVAEPQTNGAPPPARCAALAERRPRRRRASRSSASRSR